MQILKKRVQRVAGVERGRGRWMRWLVLTAMLAGALSELTAQEEEVAQEDTSAARAEVVERESESSGPPQAAPEEAGAGEGNSEASATQDATPADEVKGEPYNELLIVVGAAGEAEYGQVFEENARLWQEAASRGSVEVTLLSPEEEQPLQTLETYLTEASKDASIPLWIVLIGHGTYDRRNAFFNLVGEDLSAEMLKTWIAPFKRPVMVLNLASSSGAFLPVISGPNRIVVTATKSGTEVNYASFGAYMAKALGNPEADLNNDGENSLYELFYAAAFQTADFYAQEGRIQTETPLLDDNGDGRGTGLEALLALREGGEARQDPDGTLAKRWALVLSPTEQAIPPEMRQKRNVLESQVEALRLQRNALVEEDYYERLERLLTQIAELYAQFEQWPQETAAAAPIPAESEREKGDAEGLSSSGEDRGERPAGETEAVPPGEPSPQG